MDEPSRPFVPDWAAIKVAFEAGELPVRKIAECYGISESGVRGRAGREGWDTTLREAAKAERRKTKPKDRRVAGPTRRKRGHPAGRTPSDRAVMVARLYRVFEARIAAIEARFDPETTADAERDTRMLSALARTLDTLIALDRKAQAEGEVPTEERHDLDTLRQDLARRLDRLARRADG